MAITGTGNYFEDFKVGDVYEHPRARTVTNFDNYAVTHLSLNTAQAHFDLDYSRKALDGRFRERIVVGPCTIALVVGMTSEDMSENAFMDLGYTAIRLPSPVFAGDTLYAKSEVLELRDDEPSGDAGVMRYRFTGFNSEGKMVAEGERTVLLKKRAAWAAADGNAEATQRSGSKT
jgi:acyl dehydratase